MDPAEGLGRPGSFEHSVRRHCRGRLRALCVCHCRRALMQPCCSRCADSNGVRNVHRRWNEQQICHMPLGETIRRLGLWSGLEWEEDARTRPHAAPLALLRLRHSSDVLSTCAPRSSCDLHPLTVGEQLEGTAAAPAAQTAHVAANAGAQAISQVTSRPHLVENLAQGPEFWREL